MFGIFYGASRGIRTRVKTLAHVALLDAKIARLLGFSFPLKTSVFGDPDRGRRFSYEKNNPTPDVEWWTAEEYEKWIAEQKKELEALIGTGDGWYDGQGVFHEWTRESVDATIAEYQETLESIKNGVLYSKDNGEGDTYSMIPPSEDVVSEYGVDVTKENGESVHIGNYASDEELNQALNDAVDNGQITQADADAAHQQ